MNSINEIEEYIKDMEGELMLEYTFRESEKALIEAIKHDASIENRLMNYSSIENMYPIFGKSAKGAYIWDVDNQKYIDYIMGYGTIILGHADDRVNDLVIDEIRRGTCISPMWKPIQYELAELVKEVIPNSERAFFMKTGSDATSGAVRLARCFTGRDKVIRWGYNGWHDWATPRPLGVPDYMQKDVLKFEYNCINDLERIFNENKDQIACVIMMPIEYVSPDFDFLSQVKRVAHKNGALFIMDEMRTGFRLALGGAQEYYKVTADLATYSKAMANGYPISSIVGRQDVLSYINKTKMTATYFGSTHEMIAAKATIQILKETNTLEKIWELGKLFIERMQELLQYFEIPAVMTGVGPMPYMEFQDNDPNSDYIKRNFYGECARRGILFHPNHHWYISGAHTTKDIDITMDVCSEVFKLIKNM